MIEQTDNILFFELKTHDFVELFEGKLITKNKTLALTNEMLTLLKIKLIRVFTDSIYIFTDKSIFWQDHDGLHGI